ncbi:MAG: YciI family protein [Hyphomonadaceae bacterium]|nr:YciI family protein [Hyphomonadaceae bacterium]
MKRFILLLCSVLLVACATTPAATTGSLAEQLGADERGMRSYVLVILKTGPYTPASEQESSTLFAGHFANIERLANEGHLLVAGPLGENDNAYRGIFVISTASIDEARALVATDPTVAAGVFTVEAYRLYSSAALMQIPELHRQITE